MKTVRAKARLVAAFLLPFGLGSCRLRSDGASTDAGAEPDSPVALGQLAVLKRNCAACHQSPDPSDGVLSGQTTPVAGAQAYGSNLTPDPDTGMDAWSAADIAIALTQGIDPQGNPLCPAMPVYCDMGADEALAIAAYLQSLTPAWHPVPPSVCPPYEPLPESGIPVPREGCDGGGDAQ